MSASLVGRVLGAVDDGLERVFQWAWRHRRILGALVGVVLAAWLVARGGEAPEPEAAPAPGAALAEAPAGPADELYHRLWVDRLPKNDKEHFRMYFFLKEKNLGVHIAFHGFSYRIQEFFKFKVSGNEIAFNFPEPGVSPKAGFKLKKVSDEKHVDMEMALDPDPQSKGVPCKYFRLKDHELAELGLPSAEALAALVGTH